MLHGRYAMTVLAALVAFATTLWALPAEALPKNFRNVDTFHVGAMPTAEDVEELAMLGITDFISLHRMPRSVQARADALGLVTHAYPVRTRLTDVDDIMTLLETKPVGSIFVHCLHGADRTGAVTAYWLHTRRGYEPFAALASVTSPRLYHEKGLEMLAREYALNLSLDAELFGRYSGARNGGLEGLKVRGGKWYTALARNYLQRTLGPPLRKPAKDFWARSDQRGTAQKAETRSL